MIKLSEALAAEREKRLRAEADSSTRQQIGQAVLEALAQRLNAEPIFGWVLSWMTRKSVSFASMSGDVRKSACGRWTRRCDW